MTSWPPGRGLDETHAVAGHCYVSESLMTFVRSLTVHESANTKGLHRWWPAGNEWLLFSCCLPTREHGAPRGRDPWPDDSAIRMRRRWHVDGIFAPRMEPYDSASPVNRRRRRFGDWIANSLSEIAFPRLQGMLTALTCPLHYLFEQVTHWVRLVLRKPLGDTSRTKFYSIRSHGRT